MSGFDNIKPDIGKNLNSNISSVFSTKPTGKYSHGARTTIKINGKLAGFAFGISWRITTQVFEVNTIDDYFPYEFVPQRVTVEGTISSLHVPGTSAGTDMWQPDALNFLFQQYITIEAMDESGQLLFYTNKAMITSRAEDIKVDSLSNVQLTWRAIGFQDERKPEKAEAVGKTAGDSRLQQIAQKIRTF